jgi:ankyrin repeat protein
MEASKHGKTDAVQVLIEAGADLDLQDKNGYTALLHASEQGHTATVQALIATPADLNLRDKVSNMHYDVLVAKTSMSAVSV